MGKGGVAEISCLATVESGDVSAEGTAHPRQTNGSHHYALETKYFHYKLVTQRYKKDGFKIKKVSE